MGKPLQTDHLYVHKDPAICGGDPVVVGTRIPVHVIYRRTKAGESVEAIQRAYPHLTLAQIHDALSYAYDHVAEIRSEIQREDEAFDQGKSRPSA